MKNTDRSTIGFLTANINTGASRVLWPGILDAAEREGVNLISYPGGRLKALEHFENQRNVIFDLVNEEPGHKLKFPFDKPVGQIVGEMSTNLQLQGDNL